VAYSEFLRAPEQLLVTVGHVHERNAKAALSIEEGRTYVFDRGYFDRAFFDQIRDARAHFVTRLKRGVNLLRYGSRKSTDSRVLRDVDVTIGSAPKSRMLRLVCYRDPKTKRVYDFLTDRFDLSAVSIADAYKARWQIELFFRFLKQHLRIKRFFGTSREAVEAQLYAALIAFLLVEIARRLSQGTAGSSLLMWRSIRVALTTPSVDAVWFRQLQDSPLLHLLLSERLWT
jgi:IS4 transposase